MNVVVRDKDLLCNVASFIKATAWALESFRRGELLHKRGL